MPRRLTALLTAAIVLGLGLPLAACGGDAPAEAPGAATEAAVAQQAVTPTVVARQLPTATPTVDPAADPWFAVPDADLPDVPMPIGARRVAFAPATDTLDAAAEYAIDGFEEDKVVAWYTEQMRAFGWGLEREEDGTYTFLHTTDRSERFADEGLKRSATLLLSGSSDEADWTVIVEAPRAAGAATPAAGDGAGDGAGDAAAPTATGAP